MAAKFNSLPSGKVFLQVLGCGIEDTAPSLFLFTDSKRYLFNCGEGIQRLFTEHKIRVGKLNTLFVTQNKWSHLGGFLGLSMTLRDMGKESISIYGPTGMQKVIHGARFFLNKENIDFKVTEFSNETNDIFKDDEITIKPVVIHPESYKKIPVHDEVTQSDGDENISTYSVKPSLYNPVVCYIAKLRDFPGKLLPKVAIQLGVPKGPMFRQLKDGQSVMLSSGKVVTPEEVMEAPIPGASFLIIDCPGKKYISAITNNKSLTKCQADGKDKATMVVHMAEKDILNDLSYQQWMARFDGSTHHLLLDKKELSKCPPVFSTQFSMQYQLNQVHAGIFPLIEQWRNPLCSNGESFSIQTEPKLDVITCGNLSKFNLRPKNTLGLDTTEELKAADVDSLVKDAKLALAVVDDNCLQSDRTERRISTFYTENMNSFTSTEQICGKRKHPENETPTESYNTYIPARKACKCSSEEEAETDVEERDFEKDCRCSKEKKMNCRFPKIVFLGTGSSMPSKYRNVTSILLHASEQTTMLFDCGEGSYGQIINHYGKETEEIIRKLKFVFISHLHADHHLGLIRILKLRWKLMSKAGISYIPPIIAGPKNFSTWLREYSSVCESVRYRFVDCKKMNMKSCQSTLTKEIPEFANVTIVPVEHNTEAYGIAITHKDGWKITYSGDTKPCDSLVIAGKDSTLLIHEATFEDGMEEEAKEKHHSTCGQALEIAEKMKAKNVLLTHFSQRYAKLPVMKNKTPAAVAFDHMEVHPDDVPVINKLLPKLQILFPEEEKSK